jgi:hypothetical protein
MEDTESTEKAKAKGIAFQSFFRVFRVFRGFHLLGGAA